MSKQDADTEIKRLTAEARELIRKAEQVAEAAGVEFYFAVEYGMGGTYIPEARKNKYEPAGWNPSSHTC